VAARGEPDLREAWELGSCGTDGVSAAKLTTNQQVKLMKSFRVLRLFRRITALKKLLQSLGAALPVPPPTFSFPT
jgi:hypothetical protein